MRRIATTAAALAALALLAAGGGTSSASTLPGSLPGTATAARFSACLVTNDEGGIHHGLNNVSWKGMKAAQHAEPKKIKVKYLLSVDAADYTPNIDTFIGEKCGLIVTVGSAMALATETSAKANPKYRFAIVDCTYRSKCLTGKRLKNITSVKGTVKAVKSAVLAAARKGKKKH